MTDEGPYSLDDYADEDGPRRRTAGRKKSNLPPGLPEQGASREEFAAWLTDFAHLDDDPVVAASRWGNHGSEPVELILRSGRKVYWEQQDDLFGTKLQRPLVMVTGHKPRPLTQNEVPLVAWAVIQLATLQANATEADEFRELWDAYRSVRSEVMVDREDERAMRQLLHDWKRLADSRSEQIPFVLVDQETEERLVRRLDFVLHVRTVRRAPMSWQRLNGLARRNGWMLERLQFRATLGSEYVEAKVFLVPADWGQDV